MRNKVVRERTSRFNFLLSKARQRCLTLTGLMILFSPALLATGQNDPDDFRTTSAPLIAQTPPTDYDLVLNSLKQLMPDDEAAKSCLLASKKILFDPKGKLKNNPLITLCTDNPMYVALGVWRAHQELQFSKLISDSSLDIIFFLQLCFNKEVRFDKEVTEHKLALIPKLCGTNPSFTGFNLYNCKLFDLSRRDYRPINQDDIKPILKIAHLSTLTLKKTDINIVSLFVTHPNLTALTLEQSRVDDVGVKLLCSNTKIRYLNLSENPEITEVGILELARRMVSLRQLFLRKNNLTNTGGLALAQMTSLETLDLGHNPAIDNEVVKMFLRNTTLQVLGLRDTGVSPEQQEFLNTEIKKRHPKK